MMIQNSKRERSGNQFFGESSMSLIPKLIVFALDKRRGKGVRERSLVIEFNQHSTTNDEDDDDDGSSSEDA